ncbi:MAG: AI-2E family transporter [Chloroflexi bacterium]|jgi:predicted PurR-regulated permease PerM|nr:AI-2E family transporter [Chloroflexota bacterium]
MEVPAAPHAPTPAPPAMPAGLPVPSRRVLVLLAGTALLAALFWFGRDVLAPFVVGILIVYLLDPLVERLARVTVAGRRMPRALLILLVYLAATLILVELALLVIGPLVEQVRALVKDGPGYVEDLNARLDELLGWWNRLDLPADVKEAIDEAVADLLQNLGALIPSILRPVFSSVLGFVGSVFGYLIIPVWTFWILKDRPLIVRGFDRAVPEAWRADTWATLGIVRRVFGSWIRGQLILGLVVGVGTFIGLMVLGTFVDPVFSRYAVLLAVIAGVLELLPVIGPIIAAVPAVLLGATAGVPGIVAALLLYFAIQQIENTLLVPKIQGDATDLHPAVVIFSLILGGAIAGLLGAILALPIAATLRDLYVYAFRRAGGMTPAEAATGNARGAHDAGPAGLEPLDAPDGGADGGSDGMDAAAEPGNGAAGTAGERSEAALP